MRKRAGQKTGNPDKNVGFSREQEDPEIIPIMRELNNIEERDAFFTYLASDEARQIKGPDGSFRACSDSASGLKERSSSGWIFPDCRQMQKN
jgi:hypothetical protein